MKSVTQSVSPRERILAKAMDLFYRQGYQATGINQIIDEAGVARASFYAHFPSKDDLFLAYAKAMADQDIAEMRAGVATLNSPHDRFYGLLTLLPAWLEEFNYRGCPYQIILAEAPPGDEGLHAVSRRHHEEIIELIKELARDYSEDCPALRRMDLNHLAKRYVILMDGAIAAAVAYRENWPIEEARQTLEKIIEAAR